MALEEELVRETGVRLARLSAAVSRAACAAGIDVMRADVLGAAQAAAVMSALRVWAEEGAGRGTPESVLHEALARGKLTAADVDGTVREIRRALLDADVALAVVKDFTAKVRERALGDEVNKALNPAQQVVQIVNEELVQILG
ncbi:unnamed protein product, partial [Penicillium discolor]